MLACRVYVTAEGRHVWEGDPSAVQLVYDWGDVIPPEVLEELGPPPGKSGFRPRHKMVVAREDK